MDLTKMADAELEAALHALNAEEVEWHAQMKAKKAEIAAEIERRAGEARVLSVIDSLTEQDKEALAQHLGLPRATTVADEESDRG